MRTAEFIEAMARGGTGPVVSVENFERMILDIVMRGLQQSGERRIDITRLTHSAPHFRGPVCSSGE